jgi:hypothetical protein
MFNTSFTKHLKNTYLLMIFWSSLLVGGYYVFNHVDEFDLSVSINQIQELAKKELFSQSKSDQATLKLFQNQASSLGSKNQTQANYPNSKNQTQANSPSFENHEANSPSFENHEANSPASKNHFQVQAKDIPDLTELPEPSREDIQKVGLHLLGIHELELSHQVLTEIYQNQKSDVNAQNEKTWKYVTIPFTYQDTEKLSEWQAFFNQSRDKKIIPLIRLATEFKNEAWQKPTRYQIIKQISALKSLTWPTNKKHLIIFNEVNHAAEWGGSLDPESYADYFYFASNWAKSEDSNFVIMPGAMDLAAPNGPKTMEAFNYLTRMIEHKPEVFEAVDLWNSHSYPNPAFSAPPTTIGQNSMRGFETELDFIKTKTGRELEVFISETGWDLNNKAQPQLPEYYLYALKKIWASSRVVGVTPFVFRGDPGPFSGFSFIDASGNPTSQLQALQWAVSNQTVK